MYFKIAHKVIKYLGYLWKKICQQKQSKIPQSGHTAWDSVSNVTKYPIIQRLLNNGKSDLFLAIFNFCFFTMQLHILKVSFTLLKM